MGVPVSTFDEFRRRLSDAKGRSVIFGFLLYDSRPSQEVVNRFAQQQASWMDDLARGAGIYFFFPFKREEGEFRNPSVEMARIFELGASRFPGIVLFAPPGKNGKVSSKHAVYIPLEERDFSDPFAYEPFFEELFDLIKESIKEKKTSDKVLAHIKEDLANLRRRKSQRGVATYIRKGAHLILFDIPKAIYGPLAEGFGKALGQKAAGP